MYFSKIILKCLQLLTFKIQVFKWVNLKNAHIVFHQWFSKQIEMINMKVLILVSLPIFFTGHPNFPSYCYFADIGFQIHLFHLHYGPIPVLLSSTMITTLWSKYYHSSTMVPGPLSSTMVPVLWSLYCGPNALVQHYHTSTMVSVL